MTSTKPVRPNPLLAAVIAIAMVACVFALTLFGRQIDAALPSDFTAHLTDHSFLAWHRWWPLSFQEAFLILVLLMSGGLLAYYYIDPVYHAFHNNRPARLAICVLAIAFVLALFVYAPLRGGYAIYPNHLVVLDPFRDLDARRIDLKDIDHVETGCHERIAGRRQPNWAVPSYLIKLSDGKAVSLFDLADGRYDDPQLMNAVIALDRAVSKQGIPKRIRKNILGSDMSASLCYSRIERHYSSSLVSSIRQTFEDEVQ